MKTLISTITALALFSFSTGSFAKGAENHLISPGNVLGVVNGDWNNDGGMDRAILVAPTKIDNDVGLYIYLEENNNPKLEVFKPNLVWSGSFWGSTPSLKITAAGSLQVVSQNQAIGRYRWSKTLTIAYRNGNFVVAGYTYDSYDTLDLSAGLSCDVNLLTGSGIKNKKKFRTAKQSTKLADWTDQSLPKECQES